MTSVASAYLSGEPISISNQAPPSLQIVESTELECTLGESVSFSGVGLHTGCQTTLRLVPAPEGTGRIFRRVDLPGKPTVPASIEYLFDTSRSTNLGSGEVRIHTVEHVLAALVGCGIDNVIIELDNREPPIGDSSARPFVSAIQKAGKVKQKSYRSVVRVDEPVFWVDKGVQLVALPYHNLTISYTLHHPESPMIRTQLLAQEITEATFEKELADARTFGFYDDIHALVQRGLIKGATLENALVFHGDKILNPDGLRYPDEPVRHKILDLIGDLSLVGFPLQAYIIAVRSGHSSNVAFAKVLKSKLLSKDVV